MNGTSGMRARIWKNINYDGPMLCIYQGVRVPHHGSHLLGNDEGSSNDWQWFC